MALIVVGVDGSPNALGALHWAVEEARSRGASLRVVHSWSFPPPERGPDGLPHADLAGAAQAVLDAAVASISDPSGVEITAQIANDPPARTLIEASAEADLVVVGRRGAGGFAGLRIGSVADQVAHHAKCPVVLVPATDA